jgi:alpha-amylase
MFADLKHSHPAVKADILHWGSWITSLLGLDGMRLDAIKHYSLSFLAEFVDNLNNARVSGKDLFFVGEYWDADSNELERVINRLNGSVNLFDVQLVYNLSDFSKGRRTDLRTLFDGTLVQARPSHAVVSNLQYTCPDSR